MRMPKIDLFSTLLLLIPIFLFVVSLNSFVVDIRQGRTMFHKNQTLEDKAIDKVATDVLVLEKRVAWVEDKLKTETDSARKTALQSDKEALEREITVSKAVKEILEKK
ncbi:MAG: hypothetical protein AB2N28_2180 [Candidatus Phytoplasma solani]